MRSRARGWGRAELVAALLAAAPLVLVVPGVAAVAVARPSASTAADGACAGDSGVTVVVDFGTLGGGVQTRCAPEPVSSGFDALTRAGFTYAGTTRFPGLLCRIDGKPSPQEEACQNAPPPNYYWAYWTAPTPGDTWTYSDIGAGNRDPAAGSVEGWAFSDGCTRRPGAPTACPSTTLTSTTASPTTTRSPTSGGPPAGTGSSPSTVTTVASGATATVPGAGGSATSLDASATTEGGTTRATGDTAASAGGPEDVALGAGQDTGASSRADVGSGSPTGVMIAAAAALLLGLGALGGARRRRSASTSGSGGE